EATARLIAATPALLAALESDAEEFRSIVLDAGEMLPGWIITRIERQGRAVRSAIEAATDG
ncbi:MAG TPA: hypothetical protein VNA25_15185, partial [Phycisphaerae bacterium]|nr:hypothetical protein [Phycisphaerae bacterium]